MFRFVVHNARERQQLQHGGSPIEFGRGPRRGEVARCTIQDAYVSKDHVRVEEMPSGELRIENLSTKQPVVLGTVGTISPGNWAVIRPPIRLGIGDSFIDIELAIPDDIEPAALKTVIQPLRGRGGVGETIMNLDGSPSPEVLTQWFEAVINLQKISPASPEFYQEIVAAMVDLVYLDSGLILMRNNDAWRVVARKFRDEGVPGREFSYTILSRVVQERRTFFQPRVAMSQSDSLQNIGSVVASPIIDGNDQVIGALYGARCRAPRNREIGSLEAQLVQVLATVVSAGLVRLEQDMRAHQLRVAAEAAQAADRTKSQFLATMSHELRTPLNAIIGYSEMLQEEARDMDMPTFVNDLEKIVGSGKHLLMLINDILDLSKIEAGKMTLHLETFELPPLIKDIVNTVQPLVQKKANTLAVEMPSNLGSMHADITRVRQCLYNLLSNASKFTEQGMVRLSLARQQGQGREWMVFKVADSGIGMTPAQVKDLFKDFGQADPSTTRKYGGTGLGLAITRRFCRMMGGEITVHSEAGKGSIFTICLPATVDKVFEPTEVHPVPTIM